MPVTTSWFFYLYLSGIPFHPKCQPFTLKKLSLPFKLHSSWWCNIPITVKRQNYHRIFILNVTAADIWNCLFHILFIFTASCFFSSNPVTLWANDHSLFLSMTACWYQTDMVQYCTSLAHAATNASLELFFGATQNLVNLCCFIYKLSHWNIKTGLTLRLSVISFTLEPFSVDTQLQFLVNKVNVCLFFAFSHPSWQPLLIKNWNLKNRNQVATQYVKPLKSCQLFFFLYHIFSNHTRFRKKCLLDSFFL